MDNNNTWTIHSSKFVFAIRSVAITTGCYLFGRYLLNSTLATEDNEPHNKVVLTWILTQNLFFVSFIQTTLLVGENKTTVK